MSPQSLEKNVEQEKKIEYASIEDYFLHDIVIFDNNIEDSDDSSDDSMDECMQ